MSRTAPTESHKTRAKSTKSPTKSARERPLPAAPAQEQELISAVLCDAAGALDAVRSLSPSDFTSQRHQELVRLIKAIDAKGSKPLRGSVADAIREKGLDDVTGGAAYLDELINEIPLEVDPAGAATAIRDKRRWRETLQKAGLLRDLSFMAGIGDEPEALSLLREIESAITGVDDPLADAAFDVATMLDSEPPPTAFLADKRVPLGRGLLLTGLGGSSKTRLIYHMAFGSILGRLPWEWEISTTGKAVLVLTEDTPQDAHQITHVTAKALNLNKADRDRIKAGLTVYPMAGKDFKLLRKTQRGTLEKTPSFYALEKKIRAIGGVVFVGVDPALSVTEGDELDQGHQRALGNAVDALAISTGATVMLVSHATKASLNSGEMSSHMSRGGGAITDAVRGEYGLRNMTPDEGIRAGIVDIVERKRCVQLTVTKCNGLPPEAFVPVWLRRGEYGNLERAAVSFGEDDGPNGNDMAVLKTLDDMWEASPACVRLQDWRSRCVEQRLIAGETPGAQEKAMQRICDKLLRMGLVIKGAGRGVYIPVREDAP